MAAATERSAVTGSEGDVRTHHFASLRSGLPYYAVKSFWNAGASPAFQDAAEHINVQQ